MPQEFDNILKYNQGQKSMEIPFVTYVDTKSLLEKLQACDNNPGKESMKN